MLVEFQTNVFDIAHLKHNVALIALIALIISFNCVFYLCLGNVNGMYGARVIHLFEPLNVLFAVPAPDIQDLHVFFVLQPAFIERESNQVIVCFHESCRIIQPQPVIHVMIALAHAVDKHVLHVVILNHVLVPAVAFDHHLVKCTYARYECYNCYNSYNCYNRSNWFYYKVHNIYE